jgi:hypothetical protein
LRQQSWRKTAPGQQALDIELDRFATERVLGYVIISRCRKTEIMQILEHGTGSQALGRRFTKHLENCSSRCGIFFRPRRPLIASLMFNLAF